MVPCKSTAEEVSFEWLHHRILLTDSKVRTTLHVSIIDCGSPEEGEDMQVSGLSSVSAFVLFPYTRNFLLRHCLIPPR